MLGDLERGKVAAMRAEDTRRDPRDPERRAWATRGDPKGGQRGPRSTPETDKGHRAGFE